MAGDNVEVFNWWAYDNPPTLFDSVANGPVTKALRFCFHAVLRVYLRIYHCYVAHNAAQLLDSRPCIIVTNHASHLDVGAIISAFPLNLVNSIRCLAAKDYFFDNPFVRTLAFLAANTIPLDRKRFDAGAMAFCSKAIEQRATLVIFPEGTRSMDGVLGRFMAGIGVLAKKLNVPVIPAHIAGAHEALPKGCLIPRPTRVAITFGEPVFYEEIQNNREGWEFIAGDLEQRVRRLGCLVESKGVAHDVSQEQVDEVLCANGRTAFKRHRPESPARIHVGQDAGLRLSK